MRSILVKVNRNVPSNRRTRTIAGLLLIDALTLSINITKDGIDHLFPTFAAVRRIMLSSVGRNI
ncbi:MAG: hypothetical protein ACTS46_00805 [Candidatus Hodgkinia cicadicola]